MNPSDAIEAIEKPLSSLPYSLSRHILEHLRKLTSHEGGISGRSAKGKRIHTRAIHSIDTDIKLNRALWVMAETMLESLR